MTTAATTTATTEPVTPKQTPRRSKRWIVTLDSGREFIVYAATSAAAVRHFTRVCLIDTIAYDSRGPVLLKDLGHVVNAREDVEKKP